jgi:hypothetical protein
MATPGRQKRPLYPTPPRFHDGRHPESNLPGSEEVIYTTMCFLLLLFDKPACTPGNFKIYNESPYGTSMSSRSCVGLSTE